MSNSTGSETRTSIATTMITGAMSTRNTVATMANQINQKMNAKGPTPLTMTKGCCTARKRNPCDGQSAP